VEQHAEADEQRVDCCRDLGTNDSQNGLVWRARLTHEV
jgi:hypothetical protein